MSSDVNLALLGDNPHYIQLGNSYTDSGATYQINGGGSGTVSSSSTSPTLNVNSSGTYVQTYTYTHNSTNYGITRDIIVGNHIDISGETLHYIQTGNIKRFNIINLSTKKCTIIFRWF